MQAPKCLYISHWGDLTLFIGLLSLRKISDAPAKLCEVLFTCLQFVTRFVGITGAGSRFWQIKAVK
jgi:hypothetical protein